MNEVIEFDDGFNPTSDTARGGRNANYLKWTAEGWRDRDGMPPPQPLLVISVDEFLRCWKNREATYIRDKPLPNVDEINATIPLSEWEKTKDGKPRPPWEFTVGVYLVSLANGERYTFASATVGAQIAQERLKEAVVTMRMIRGDKAMPLVELKERPMKTQYKMASRPHFEIVGWKTPGENQSAIAAPPAAPQLSSPAAAKSSVSEPATKTKPETITSGPIDKPEPAKQVAKPKRQVSATLAQMGDVKPATTTEIIGDNLPY